MVLITHQLSVLLLGMASETVMKSALLKSYGNDLPHKFHSHLTSC